MGKSRLHINPVKKAINHEEHEKNLIREGREGTPRKKQIDRFFLVPSAPRG
jgi:hypothetical protein